MFILKSSYEYPDDLAIISKSHCVLEEIALSLYEEDTYEWFCVLNEEKPQYVNFYAIIEEAKERAKCDSELYNITEAVELEF